MTDRIIHGDRVLYESLDELASRTDSMKPVMNEIGEIIHESVERNFEEGGRPAWPDLAPSTKKQRKRKRKWPGKILVRKGKSGGLFGSVGYKATDDHVVVFANKEYARIHQEGGEIKHKARDRVLHFRQYQRGAVFFGRRHKLC
ncbi:MAG: phage virion morphogenesis protein [Desulfobacteraceae bacterium]|nr:phage virion morphogenesis protein [Desulfobacteraceae bacterium]